MPRKAGKGKGVELLRKAYKVRSKQLDEINLVSPWHHLYREVTLPKLLKSIPVRRAKVLDAGGGTVNLASDLAKRGYAVTLVDVLPDMIAVARSRAAITPFEIFEGNLEDLSFLQAGSFDAIVCTQVLNFCADLGRVFKEFARILKPSGVLFADIDNAYRWAAVEALSGHLDNAQRIIVSGRDEARNIIGTGYFFHSEQELRGLLGDAGLTVQGMWGVGYIAPLIHVFAESKRFLNPSRLPARARIFADPKAIMKLARLESELARRMPLELAGWSQFLLFENHTTRTLICFLVTVVITGMAAYWGEPNHLALMIFLGGLLFFVADMWIWTQTLEYSLFFKSGLPVAIKSAPVFFDKILKACEYYQRARTQFKNETFHSHLNRDIDKFLETLKCYAEGRIDKAHSVIPRPFSFGLASDVVFENKFMATSLIEEDDYWLEGEGLSLLKKQGEIIRTHPGRNPEDVTMRIFIRPRDKLKSIEQAIRQHEAFKVPVKIALTEDIQQKGEALLKDFMLVDDTVLVRQENAEGTLFTRVWIRGIENARELKEANDQFAKLRVFAHTFGELQARGYI